MNLLDLITIGIILVCVLICYARGLLISVFNLASLFISFMLTRQLYPVAGKWLRGTPVFDSLKQAALNWLGGGVTQNAGEMVGDAVEAMHLPDAFRAFVLENLSSVPQADIASAYDYVAGLAAGLIIDAIAIILVFAAVFIIMRIIGAVLKLVSRMPVIRTFNHIGGGVMGLIVGVLLSWVALWVMRLLFASSTDFPVETMLTESLIAKFFLLNL